MSKAQVISGDFTISIAVFIAILIMVLPLWGYVESQVKGNEERRDMESSLLIVSDVLTKTHGLPFDWNESNVRSIGLAGKEGVLNITKVLNLVGMDYDNAREILGINNYGLYISFRNIDGQNMTSGVAESDVAYFSVNSEAMKNIIANSGLVWDYYYGGSGTPDKNDSRSFYSAAKQDAFNAMLSNSSLYRTMIIEEPELLESEVNIDEMKNFLNMGGLIIFEGSPDVIKDSFGMHADQSPGRTGLIVKKDRFVISELGKSVTFADADWAFYQAVDDNSLTKLIEDQADSSDAVVGYWEYGLGRIYYISDISGTVDSSPLQLNIAGQRLEFGSPVGGNTIVKIQRLVLLSKERNVVADMDMLLWK